MTSCKIYTEEFISQFVDNEVSPFDQDEFVRHMADCRACNEIEGRFRQVPQVFEGHVAAQAFKIPPISLEKKNKQVNRPNGLLLRLASLGTAALIFAFFLFTRAGDPIREPSAIINSVDTYGSSVMIIDTQETQHTIIWFSET